jgi:TRAP-type C4-dicarboxylate transport system permease small subunit
MNPVAGGARRGRDLVAAVPRYLVGALMVVITLLVNIEVALRFFVNLPLDGLSELVLLLFPWLSLVGAAVAFDTLGANVAIHLLGGHLSQRARDRIGMVVGAATTGFGVFLIVHGTGYALMTRTELTNTLEISRSWDIVAFPVSGALIVLYSLRTIWRLVHRQP